MDECPSRTPLTILSIILLAIVLGLITWIILLVHRSQTPCPPCPPCPPNPPTPPQTSGTPFYLYGFNENTSGPQVNNSSGVLTIANNVPTITQNSQSTAQQWYIVPTSGGVALQNVSTGQYLVSPQTTISVNLTPSLSSATVYTLIGPIMSTNTFLFTANGRYISTGPSGSIQQNSDSLVQSQWLLQPISATNA